MIEKFDEPFVISEDTQHSVFTSESSKEMGNILAKKINLLIDHANAQEERNERVEKVLFELSYFLEEENHADYAVTERINQTLKGK